MYYMYCVHYERIYYVYMRIVTIVVNTCITCIMFMCYVYDV